MEVKTLLKLVVMCVLLSAIILIIGCEEKKNDDSITEETEIKLVETESNEQEDESNNQEESFVDQKENKAQEDNSDTTVNIDIPGTVLPLPETDEYGFTEQQRNSFAMLYHLTITAEKIRISKDNRLILDDIYTSLLNDINPGAIDDRTQRYLNDLISIINSYIDISIKRDRLEYIYNQDKASAIRTAVPNPLAVLSITNSFDWKKLVTNVAYTIVDSYNNYKSSKENISQEYLLSGWELDDEELDTIRKNREEAFEYMTDIVQEYGLDGRLTLNERAVETFAEICSIESIHEKISRLEYEKDRYKLLGLYWLELADCYYEVEEYSKCLDCIDKYNSLEMNIYTKDYNYAHILPKAFVAAQEVYKDDEYILKANEFSESILDNTDTEEWSVRYFVAQIYMDLYVRTNNKEYLDRAYEIARSNVSVLLTKQRELNEEYLNEVKVLEAEEPDYRFLNEKEKKLAKQEYKKEQKQINVYNKELKERRKTELPPLYEPLILNCELLFAIAEEKGIDDYQKENIDKILHDKNALFLSKPINCRYSFSDFEYSYDIDFSKNRIVIPADLLSKGAEVIVSITEGDKTVTIEDCVVDSVKRDGDTVDSFNAHISSKQMKDYKWTKDSSVVVSIINTNENDPLTFHFRVSEYNDNWLIADKVVFEKE